MKKILYTGIAVLLLAACSKKGDDDNAGKEQEFTNRLTFIIDDNKFNFSFFNTALRRTEYRNLLAGDGPYTVLVPDNSAFNKAGYGREDAVLTENLTVLNNLVSYHILNGNWDFNKLPFTFNQQISSITGASMFVTRWVKNGDTVLTINGTRILSRNLKASNGSIQVMDQLLQPMLHQKVSSLIASDTTLSFFNVALQRADMKKLLEGEENYTVFAPANNAFRAAGYPSAESVLNADPIVLKNMLQYQLFRGRRFIYDYILTTGSSDLSEQAMLNGNNIQVALQKQGVNYTGIRIKGVSNATYSNIVKGNLLAGNGVVHITDQLLKENQ